MRGQVWFGTVLICVIIITHSGEIDFLLIELYVVSLRLGICGAGDQGRGNVGV